MEDPRTAIFVKGTHTGEKVNNVMKELVCSSLKHICEIRPEILADGTQTSALNILLEEKRRSSFRGRLITRILGPEERCKHIRRRSEHEKETGRYDLRTNVRLSRAGYV